MKSITEQLSTYKSVHLNASNIKTHFIGIPLIIWSIALLLNMISVPLPFLNVELGLGIVIGLSACVYYVILHFRLACFVVLLFGPIVYSTTLLANYEHTIVLAITVFVIGWILQFIGHAYEKAKPAFVDDLNQLLIGPLFLIAEIYFALGLDKSLEQDVTDLAIDKRKAFEQAKG